MAENSSQHWNETFLTHLPYEGIAQAEVWMQIIIFFFFVSATSGVGYTMVAVGIIKTKELHTRFFIIICFLCIIRAMCAYQFVFSFFHRSLRMLRIFPTNIKQSYCFLLTFGFLYPPSVEMVLLIVATVDRSLALFRPMYYRTLTKKQATVACAIVWTFVMTIKLTVISCYTDFSKVSPCVNGASAITALGLTIHSDIEAVLAVVIFLLYVVLFLVIRFRLKTVRATSLYGVKVQEKLMVLTRRMIVVHCGFVLTVKLTMSLMSLVDFSDSISSHLLVYISASNTLDLLCNLIILLRHEDLKKATFPFMYKKASRSTQKIANVMINVDIELSSQ